MEFLSWWPQRTARQSGIALRACTGGSLAERPRDCKRDR